MCCPALLRTCGNHSGEAERSSGIALKLFGFIPEPVFTFIRNPVRDHPEIPFGIIPESRSPYPGLPIPGHGPVGNKAGLSEYYDMLVAIRGNVSKLKTQGKSLAETIAAKPTAAYDAKWGQFLMTPAIFTKLVYSGV